jgi:hypothetical protein
VLYDPAQFERLTDEPWDPARVEDAIRDRRRRRRFAGHALGQAERLRAENGRGRYSLWTGDVGTALFAAACLDVDARYPILDVV